MLNNTNTYLQSAKRTKNDEFYTPFEVIEEELLNYIEQFTNKVVLCNCDDPFESDFCKFFIYNFKKLNLKKLICTSYGESKLIKSLSLHNNKGYVLQVEEIDEDLLINKTYKEIIKNLEVKELAGNGDFSSKECLNFLEEADIIVTNPPFSLFRQFVSLLFSYRKKFLIIGNMNAITYKEIFPYVKSNEAWLGYHNGDMAFRVPADSEPRKTRFWIDETGQKWRSIGNAMWFTNLDVAYRHKFLELREKYSSSKYPHFDNYDAINVSRVADIPMDYEGIMAVPLTILNKYNPEQFEIIGEANHGSDNPYDLFKPTINGKDIFKRILIKRVL